MDQIARTTPKYARKPAVWMPATGARLVNVDMYASPMLAELEIVSEDESEFACHVPVLFFTKAQYCFGQR
jgi:hypothetical protein